MLDEVYLQPANSILKWSNFILQLNTHSFSSCLFQFSTKRDPLKRNITSLNYRASAFYVTFYTQVLKIEPGIIARIFF